MTKHDTVRQGCSYCIRRETRNTKHLRSDGQNKNKKKGSTLTPKICLTARARVDTRTAGGRQTNLTCSSSRHSPGLKFLIRIGPWETLVMDLTSCPMPSNMRRICLFLPSRMMMSTVVTRVRRS